MNTFTSVLGRARQAASEGPDTIPWPVHGEAAATPRLLMLTDRRRLAYRVYGQVGGQPVYFFHGLPGSRLQAALLHDQARCQGVALVAFDRPGFGHSDPWPAPTVDSVIGDVEQLADHLGHRRFATLGVSCGGPYALATARLMRQRVSAVGLLAGMGPMDMPYLRHDQLPLLKLMFGLGRIAPALVTPMLALDGWLFRHHAERAVATLASMLAAPDRQLLAQRPDVRRAFAASLADAYRQGSVGARGEVARIVRHRAAALDGVPVPVHVFQGGHDRHVPPAMGRFMAKRLARPRWHDCPDDGHLSIVVNRGAECLRLLRAEG